MCTQMVNSKIFMLPAVRFLQELINCASDFRQGRADETLVVKSFLLSKFNRYTKIFSREQNRGLLTLTDLSTLGCGSPNLDVRLLDAISYSSVGLELSKS